MALASAEILARSGGGRGELCAAPRISGGGLVGGSFVDAVVRPEPRRIPLSLLSKIHSAVTRDIVAVQLDNQLDVDYEKERQQRGEVVVSS